MSREHLWVYGTLRYTCRNPQAVLLRQSASYLGLALVQARLYRIDWYPGVVLAPAGEDAGEDWVAGDLFEILDAGVMAELDRYEGASEYRRVETEAVLESGRRVTCWVYEYILPVNESWRIISGDWLKDNGAP